MGLGLWEERLIEPPMAHAYRFHAMLLLSFWLTWWNGCYNMLELMYTHFKQTNTKDSRLMASNHFFKCVFSKIYLHMATHGYTYTWLHMATHPLHIWEIFQDRQLYGLRFCHSLGRRGLNVRHLIQISPSNWPFKHKTSQNVLLSTGFLYDYMF